MGLVHPEQTTRECLPTRFSEVTITRQNGRTVTKRVREAKGQPKNRLTPDELEAKFRDAAGRGLDVDRVLSILHAVRSLETVPDVSALARLMSTDVR